MEQSETGNQEAQLKGYYTVSKWKFDRSFGGIIIPSSLNSTLMFKSIFKYIASYNISVISIIARTWCHSLESESLVVLKGTSSLGR